LDAEDQMAMKALPLAGLTLLMLVSAGPSAHTASFNCEKAEAADETAICADRELDDHDVELSVLYTQLKLLLAMRAAVLWRTRRWPGSSGVRPAAGIGPA
jgi:uncharacterized protein